MPFFNTGRGGKSPFGKDFQVIACGYIGNASSRHTVTIKRTDADFVMCTSTYKTQLISNTFAANGTNNCAVVLSGVGKSATISGMFKITDGIIGTSGSASLTWESANTVTLVPASDLGDSCIELFFCKYI